MSPPAPKPKPGRRSTVATHPRRAEIELACAAGTSLRDVARTFGITSSALHRHWHGLPEEERAYLGGMAHELAAHQASLSRVFASAITRAGAHPRPACSDRGEHAHAA